MESLLLHSAKIPAEVELADGSHKPVKFIKLTDAGLEFDPDKQDEESAE